QLSVVSGQWSVRSARRRVFYCLLLTAYCLLFLGCRSDMQDQPRYIPLRQSTFFKDGLSSRTPVEGTVPRGYLRADRQLFTGQIANANTQARAATTTNANAQASTSGNANTQAGGTAGAQNNNAGAQSSTTTQTQATATQQQPAGDANDVDEFPFPVTQEVMERGKERFEIFCAMCHGFTGEGDGMIVRRGYRKPPSYHEPRLQQARVGYFFRVMTEGYGAMPSYRSQVPVQDRWAIAAYIRALQLSHMNQTQAAPANAESGGHK
ncbi:MAG TPA: cytochrome c, partial [Pyrinomonadaceae bacterium]|nr:cytochrome c [Pyrinomonadaceae bacterium]